jgi:hypothetical protein
MLWLPSQPVNFSRLASDFLLKERGEKSIVQIAREWGIDDIDTLFALRDMLDELREIFAGLPAEEQVPTETGDVCYAMPITEQRMDVGCEAEMDLDDALIALNS